MQMAFRIAPFENAHFVIERKQALGQPGDPTPSAVATRSRVLEPHEQISARTNRCRCDRRGSFGVDRLVHATIEVDRRFRRQRLGGVLRKSFDQFRTRHARS
jgi:hypothetical protein